MILERLRVLLFGSLRRQLIISVAMVHAVMMTLFIWDLTQRQQDLILDRQAEQAATLARTLAISASGWLAANDVSGLQELAEAQTRYPELEYAMLLDEPGRVLAHTDRSRLGAFVLDLPKLVEETVLSRESSLVDVLVPAKLGTTHVGWVRVGVGQRKAGQKLSEITRSGVLYALGAIIVGSLLAGFMGTQFTRRLYKLQAVMNDVRLGNHQARCALTGTDEAAAMADNFNIMLDILHQREQEVKRSEDKYRFLIDSIQVGIIVHDSQTQIITSNVFAQTLLGLSKEEMEGKQAMDPSWHFLRKDGTRMPVDEYPVHKVLGMHRSLRDYTVGIHRRDQASITWVLVHADLVSFEDERLSQILVSFVDITERNEAEKKLESQNSLLSALINSPKDIIIFSLDKDYRYSIFNEAHRKEMKRVWNVDIAVGMNLLECIHDPQLRTLAKKSIDRALAGEGFTEEQRQITPELFYEFAWNPIFHKEQIIGATVFIRDITERKRAEEAIFEGQQVFRTLVENSPDIIARYDQNCRRTYVNPVYLQEAHIPPSELLETTPTQRSPLPPASADALQELLRSVLDSGVGHAIDVIWTKPDKRDHWYNIYAYPEFDRTGQVVSVMTISRDITVRKNAEEAIRKSEARLNEAQRIAQVGSWDLDIANDVLSWSDEIFRMFEIDPKKFRASYEAFLDSIHPDDRATVHLAYTNSLKNRTPYSLDHRLLMGDGRVKCVHEQCETFFDSSGKPVRSMGTVQDITERKQTESALRQLNRELRAITNCNEVLVRAETEQSLLNSICQIICEDAGYRMAWVGFAEDDEEKTIRPVAWSGEEAGYLEAARLTWADTERGHGPAGVAIRKGESSCIQDFISDPLAIPWREEASRRGYRSCLALPLKDETAKTFGLLTIYSTDPNSFTPDEIRLLEDLAGDLSFGIIALRSRIERRRAEEALSVSERKLAEATRIAHVGYWDRDYQTETITLSDEACRIFGLPSTNMFPKLAEWHEQWKMLIHPDDQPPTARAVTEALAGGPRYDVEYRVVRSNGEVRYIHSFADVTRDESGKAIRMFGTMIDITERKLAEKERLAHVKFLESLDQINRIIQGTNDLEKMMSDVLEAVLGVFNCDRVFLMYPCDPEAATWGVPVERHKPEYPGVHDFPQEIPMDQDVARTLRELLASDRPLKFGPATERPVPEEVARKFGFQSFMSMALFPKVGSPWQFGLHQCSYPRIWSPDEENLLLEIGQRLTDGLSSLLSYRNLLQMEEKLRSLNMALEQRVKDRTEQLEMVNKELEAFAYSVAHDLRAPLRHIDGFLELLHGQIASTLDEKCRDYMSTISESARKMGRLIDDLLAFSRLGRSEMSKKKVDLGTLVREVIQDLDIETTGRTITWNISELPIVAGDRTMLRQVLFNLLSNAVKYTRPKPQAIIEIGRQAEGNQETIFIKDNGVGFNMKYTTKLFGVFQRLHRAEDFEGNGIGLANVRRIITRHGGKTWAEGRENQGAVFYFSLPQREMEEPS